MNASITQIGALAGLLSSLLLLPLNNALGQVPETRSGKGGAMLLMRPWKPVSRSDFQRMTCPKCMDTLVALKRNEPTKGAGAKALMAGGVPTSFVPRHNCDGCSVVWSTTGHGKAKLCVAEHKCESCGSEMADCCNTRKSSAVATKGMEKPIQVAPLK